MKYDFKISIVSPVYQAEKIVDELVKRIVESASQLTDDFEIILVEDGSQDQSWEKIAENCRKFKFVKGVKLSRNFGQHAAISAGLNIVEGEYVVVMDCDLQDDPKYIKDLIEESQKGFDIVFTIKKTRKHSFLKNFTARVFYIFFNFLINNDSFKADKQVGAYSLISRKVVLAFRQFTEYHRHYLMVLRWLGFSNSYIEIESSERYEGTSSYTFYSLVEHAMNGIISQTNKLLRLNIYLGFFISTVSFLMGIGIILLYFIQGFKSGWASVMVTLFFSLGILLTSIGIVGLYIGKVFEQVKDRPKYLIDEKINF